MSTNEKKPRQTLDHDFIDGAGKLDTQEGTILAVAAEAVYAAYSTFRQRCQKTTCQGLPDERHGSRRTGCCYANRVTERFRWSLRHE